MDPTEDLLATETGATAVRAMAVRATAVRDTVARPAQNNYQICVQQNRLEDTCANTQESFFHSCHARRKQVITYQKLMNKTEVYRLVNDSFTHGKETKS